MVLPSARYGATGLQFFQGKDVCYLTFYDHRGLGVLINCIDAVSMFSRAEHTPYVLSKLAARISSPSPMRIGAISCKSIQWSPNYKLMQSTMRTPCLWAAMMLCCTVRHVAICSYGTKRVVEFFAAWTMVKVRPRFAKR